MDARVSGGELGGSYQAASGLEIEFGVEGVKLVRDHDKGRGYGLVDLIAVSVFGGAGALYLCSGGDIKNLHSAE